MRVIEQVDTGSGLGIDRLVLESDHGQLRIEIIYSAEGFEIRAVGPPTCKLLIKPIASNAIELRPTKY